MEWLLVVIFLGGAQPPMELPMSSEAHCRSAGWQVRLDYALQLAEQDGVTDPKPSDAPVIVTCLKTRGQLTQDDGLGVSYMLREGQARIKVAPQASGGGQRPQPSQGPQIPSAAELRQRIQRESLELPPPGRSEEGEP